MRLSLTHRGAILAALLALFIGTRTSHFDPLPDAFGRRVFSGSLLRGSNAMASAAAHCGRGALRLDHHYGTRRGFLDTSLRIDRLLVSRSRLCESLARRSLGSNAAFAATVPGILLAGATLLAAFTTWDAFLEW